MELKDGLATIWHTFADVARVINSTMAGEEVLHTVVRSTAQALGAKACSLMLLTPDKEYLQYTAVFGLSERYLRKGLIRSDRSIAEALEGRPVALLDATRDPRIQYHHEAHQEGIASILCWPVMLRGEVVGVLRVYTAEPQEFSATERDFVGAMAELGALALANVRLFEALKGEYETVRRELLEWYAFRARSSTPPIRFAHPSEQEFARILDFYRVRWLYEPRSFPLAWEGERVTEMFTPDFYLLDLDLYVELTTMKQSLVTAKNRKLRHLRELYPDVNVRLLYRKDYHRLLAKYGYGPLGLAEEQRLGRILITEAELEQRVAALGRQLSQDYGGRRPLFVGVLRGVICFMADLLRHISLPAEVDFMAVASYEGTSPSALRFLKDLSLSPTGRHVLLVEDIVDTGMTLHLVVQHLQDLHPASLEVCTLLDKRSRRLIDVPLRYVGFEIPDEFVVGYGLDFREEYRNLPFIATLKAEPEGQAASRTQKGSE